MIDIEVIGRSEGNSLVRVYGSRPLDGNLDDPAILEPALDIMAREGYDAVYRHGTLYIARRGASQGVALSDDWSIRCFVRDLDLYTDRLRQLMAASEGYDDRGTDRQPTLF